MSGDPLVHRERPAAGEPAGLLVLHHGRGADEHDLLGLADVLDPEQRLHVVTPRAPLTAAGLARPPLVRRAARRLSRTRHVPRRVRASSRRFHDELWERTGLTPEQTVFGGFSMGSVMSYALGLGPDRPAPAGILAFSGFVPVVDGWQPDLASRPGPARVHRPRPARPGDGRRLRPRRRATCSRPGGLDVEYHESDAAHYIDPEHIGPATRWLGETLNLT